MYEMLPPLLVEPLVPLITLNVLNLLAVCAIKFALITCQTCLLHVISA